MTQQHYPRLIPGLLLTLLLLGLSACASPAHHNTMRWDQSNKYLLIHVIEPDHYLIDGMVFSHASLTDLLQSRIEQGLTTPVLIDAASALNPFRDRPYYAMADVAELAELNHIAVYRFRLGVFPVQSSSRELLSLREFNAPELDEDTEDGKKGQKSE